MARNIWTGKEPFLRDPEAEKNKHYSMAVFAGILLVVVLIAILAGRDDSEEASLPSAESKAEDDLSGYRNMTAKEILDKLNEEKGFKEKNPLREVEMIAESYNFEPNEVKAKKGDKLRLKIVSVDTNHSIRIPSFFVERDIVYGKNTTIEFIADKKGEFIFYSTEDDNMKGKIIVD